MTFILVQAKLSFILPLITNIHETYIVIYMKKILEGNN